MSFLLRAALVIGALSFLALREAPGGHEAGARREGETLSAVLNGVPNEIRARATQAAEAEIVRRFSEARPSQDTLSATDRRLPSPALTSR